jgi:hypothetical protein
LGKAKKLYHDSTPNPEATATGWRCIKGVLTNVSLIFGVSLIFITKRPYQKCTRDSSRINHNPKKFIIAVLPIRIASFSSLQPIEYRCRLPRQIQSASVPFRASSKISNLYRVKYLLVRGREL